MNRGWHFEIHSTLIGQISCTDYELLGHGQLAAFLQFLKLVTPTSLWEDILPPLIKPIFWETKEIKSCVAFKFSSLKDILHYKLAEELKMCRICSFLVCVVSLLMEMPLGFP